MRRPGRLYDFARYTRTDNAAFVGVMISWPFIAIFALAAILTGTSHDGDMDLVRLAYSTIAPAFPELSIGGTF